MNGTEKQIAWAAEIKQKWIDEARTYLTNGRESAIRAIAAGKKTQEEIDAVLSRYEKALVVLTEQEDAQWFINHRSLSGKDIMYDISNGGSVTHRNIE
jgi:hypothetical protein